TAGGSEDNQGLVEQALLGKPGEQRRHIVVEGRDGGRHQALVGGHVAQHFLVAGGIPGGRFLAEGGKLHLGIEVAIFARHAVVGRAQVGAVHCQEEGLAGGLCVQELGGRGAIGGA